MERPASHVLAAQGLYYVTTGLWPLVSIGTFMAVTGPKTDRWLVKTVGVLAAVIGATLLGAATKRRTTPEILFLAAGSALGFSGIDLVYSLKGRIAPVYLVDVPPQLLFAAAAISLRRGRGQSRRGPQAWAFRGPAKSRDRRAGAGTTIRLRSAS